MLCISDTSCVRGISYIRFIYTYILVYISVASCIIQYKCKYKYQYKSINIYIIISDYICIYVQNNENNAKIVLCFSLIIFFSGSTGSAKKCATTQREQEGFAARTDWRICSWKLVSSSVTALWWHERFPLIYCLLPRLDDIFLQVSCDFDGWRPVVIFSSFARSKRNFAVEALRQLYQKSETCVLGYVPWVWVRAFNL